MEEQNSTSNSDVYHQLRSPPRRRSLPLINEGIAQRKLSEISSVFVTTNTGEQILYTPETISEIPGSSTIAASDVDAETQQALSARYSQIRLEDQQQQQQPNQQFILTNASNTVQQYQIGTTTCSTSTLGGEQQQAFFANIGCMTTFAKSPQQQLQASEIDQQQQQFVPSVVIEQFSNRNNRPSATDQLLLMTKQESFDDNFMGRSNGNSGSDDDDGLTEGIDLNDLATASMRRKRALSFSSASDSTCTTITGITTTMATSEQQQEACSRLAAAMQHSCDDQQKQQRSATKICRVCGDKAYSYNFNVITCESCKSIRCPFTGNCDITVRSRRFCQRCRLKKCFAEGMKKEWIMSEEARLEKKQRIQDNRQRRLVEQKRMEDEQVAQEHAVDELERSLLGTASTTAPLLTVAVNAGGGIATAPFQQQSAMVTATATIAPQQLATTLLASGGAPLGVGASAFEYGAALEEHQQQQQAAAETAAQQLQQHFSPVAEQQIAQACAVQQVVAALALQQHQQQQQDNHSAMESGSVAEMLSTLSAAQQQQSQFSAPIDEAISGTTALTAPDTTTDQITPAFCQSLFNGIGSSNLTTPSLTMAQGNAFAGNVFTNQSALASAAAAAAVGVESSGQQLNTMRLSSHTHQHQQHPNVIGQTALEQQQQAAVAVAQQIHHVQQIAQQQQQAAQIVAQAQAQQKQQQFAAAMVAAAVAAQSSATAQQQQHSANASNDEHQLHQQTASSPSNAIVLQNSGLQQVVQIGAQPGIIAQHHQQQQFPSETSVLSSSPTAIGSSLCDFNAGTNVIQQQQQLQQQNNSNMVMIPTTVAEIMAQQHQQQQATIIGCTASLQQLADTISAINSVPTAAAGSGTSAATATTLNAQFLGTDVATAVVQHQLQQQQQQQSTAMMAAATAMNPQTTSAAAGVAAAANLLGLNSMQPAAAAAAATILAATVPSSQLAAAAATATAMQQVMRSPQEMVAVPKELLMRLLEEKMENDRKAENEQQQQHNQTPPKCNCICQCGRYLSDSPIVDKVMADLLEGSSKHILLNSTSNSSSVSSTNSQLPLQMLGKQESMDVQQNQQKGEENTSSNNILSGTGGLTLADHEAVAEINKANELWTSSGAVGMPCAPFLQLCPTETNLRRLISTANSIRSFRALDKNDQIQILRRGCEGFFILRGLLTYNEASAQLLQQHGVPEAVLNYYNNFPTEYRANETINLLLGILLLYNAETPELKNPITLAVENMKYQSLLKRLMHTLCVQDSLKASTIATELILSIDHLRQLSLTSATTDASTANSFGTNETNQQQQSGTEGIPTPTGAFNGEPTPPSPPIINQPAEFGTEQQTASDAPASMFHMFNTRTEALCGEPMAISGNNITATALMRMESNNTNNSTGTTSVSVTMVPMFTH